MHLLRTDESYSEVTHSAQDFQYVEPCDSTRCYNLPISYNATNEQIKALMELSETCTQYIEVCRQHFTARFFYIFLTILSFLFSLSA